MVFAGSVPVYYTEEYKTKLNLATSKHFYSNNVLHSLLTKWPFSIATSE